jgi:glycosyltransferase involved in cell wall biosynthesis
MMMRILWVSNAPWKGSGYGNQTRLIMEHLPEYGHDLAIACNFGLQGGVIEGPKGVRFYPSGYDANSNDIVQAHADDFKADVIISLYDAWPLKFANLKTPWVAWTPVDHEPVPPPVLEALKPASAVVAYSRFGEKEFEKAGVKASYIPHGIDTKVFTPGDKREARRKLGLPEEAFVVGMVAANNFYPSRKCIPQALQAFAVFAETHPNAVLYLHTEERGLRHGVNVPEIARSLNLGDKLKLCDQYQYAVGFPEGYMVEAYRAFDVLLSPSMGEGFGIPMMEAQACGTPVIATAFSAMPELVAGGLLIDEYERWWEPQGAWMALPRVAGIVRVLENVHRYTVSGETFLYEAARTLAEAYDFERVVAPMWHEFLQKAEWRL